MDAYKVKQLKQMLAHETSEGEEHYGARLSALVSPHQCAHHRRRRSGSPYQVLRDA